MSSQFVFYGGKGGVGKTTCAAAGALQAASRSSALVISTDPAHSLGDVFRTRLSSRPRRVTRNLDGVELDAPRAFARWLDDHRSALSSALEHGTWLDREDIAALLDLTIPGVDELVGLLEIVRLADIRRATRSPLKKYDVVVVDTAPTGHTLRLLAAPDTVSAMAGVLDALQEEHRIIRQRFAGRAKPEAADRLVELLAQQAADTAAILRNPDRARFHWVTLPEPMAIAESADGLSSLSAAGIAVSTLIVNRVLPDDDPCPLCDGRRAEERKALASIRKGIGRGRRVQTIPAQLQEPRGLAALKRISATTISSRPSSISHRPLAISHKPSAIDGEQWPEMLQSAELIFVGGKGGVGKTTVAASIALRLAEASPRDSILLLSTDPAHSLADVLGEPIDDTAQAVKGAPANLFVREIDAAAALAVKRAALQAALEDVSASTGGAQSSLSSQPLLDLAPPGIDELFGMLSVVDARASHRTIVVDTAPTGHALRLLEMPETARAWVQLLLRILLKYKTLVRPGRLAAELVEASQSIRELQSVLRDPARTRFVVVTRAAAVPRAETERLVRRLRSLQLSTPAIVVNARTLAPGSCRRCRATNAAERRELAALTRFRRAVRLHDCAIIQTPLVAPPPRGANALNRWARTWITASP